MSVTTLFLHCAALLLASPPTAYRGVVVDAVTRKPLPSVSVQRLEAKSAQLTDMGGNFTFNQVSGNTMRLRLTSLGYAVADLTRPVAAGIDTIALTPISTVLSEVTVRPRHEVVVQPFLKMPRANSGFFLIPSVQIATQLPALANGATGTLSRLQIQLKPSAIKVGGLRVRLLAVPEGGEVVEPTGQDLLEKPLEITAAELAAAPKGAFSLDLSAYNVAMPATGVFVMLESLGVTPDQKYVSMTMPTNGHSALVVTGTEPGKSDTYQVTKLNDYPQLQMGDTSEGSRTWILGSNGRGWRQTKAMPGEYQIKNTLISVAVLVD